MTALDGAELVLGLPIREHASHGTCELSELFGTSMLWWSAESKLLSVPDFYFGFTLALREPRAKVDVNQLHNSLLYQYMRALKLGKSKREFEASLEGDWARRLDAKQVSLAVENEAKELVKIEALLGKAQLQNVRALFDERSHAYRRAKQLNEGPTVHSPFDEKKEKEENEEEEDLSCPLHQLFDITPWSEDSFESNDAFRSVYTIKCRNHVLAATVIAALFPYAPFIQAPSNPLPDNKGCGTIFFLGEKCKTFGYLVRATGKKLSVIFRGHVPENTAIHELARQLGFKETLRQAVVVNPNPNPNPHPNPDSETDPEPNPLPVHFGRGAAVLLAPVDMPQYHPIFSRAVAKPRPDLLVSVRTQASPATTGLEKVRYNCDLLRCGDFTYVGELGIDCIIEQRFGFTSPTPRTPPPARHAGGIEGRKKVVKRLRELNDDSDGLPRAKRIHLLRDTLEYQTFLRSLRRTESIWELVLLLVGEGDFLEVLSHHKSFEGLSSARIYSCRDIALKLDLFSMTSSVAQRFDAFLREHPPIGEVRTWMLWWE